MNADEILAIEEIEHFLKSKPGKHWCPRGVFSYSSAFESYLHSTSFGNMTREFVDHVSLKLILKEIDDDQFPEVALRIAIEDFLLNINDPNVSAARLETVKAVLSQCLKYATPADKAQGRATVPIEIVKPQFIRKLYATNNDKLINLFMEFLPKPRSYVFETTNIPDQIKRDEEAAAKTIKSALANDLYTIEKHITKIQRMFRAKKKKKEDVSRVMHYYSLNMHSAAEKINEANMSYRPKADDKLSNRIMKATKSIQLFSVVKHKTSRHALESIMNDGLFGRKNMLDFYMDFKPASLSRFDTTQGDLNVICMGASTIDPRADHGIELCFDAEKISQDNPCVFFKQRDLGFSLVGRPRIVRIGDLGISFSHTDKSCSDKNKSEFLLFRYNPENYCARVTCARALVDNQLLISHNIKNMHKILVQNFFRFIDSLEAVEANATYPMAKEIYAALENLNDEELAKVLKDIGKKISDTMEFNFYGAYQIDFSVLISISNGEFCLNLGDFICELNQGKMDALSEAEKNIPEMFKSYRFVDYLLSKVTNESLVSELKTHRNNCQVPHYMKPF